MSCSCLRSSSLLSDGRRGFGPRIVMECSEFSFFVKPSEEGNGLFFMREQRTFENWKPSYTSGKMMMKADQS